MRPSIPHACPPCPQRGCNFICKIKNGETDSLPLRTTSRTYLKKQVLFYEGIISNGIYIVRSGKVKVYKTGPEGKQHILQIASNNDILGLDTVFGNEEHTATAEMIEDGMICFIDKQSIRELIRKYPELAINTIQHLSSTLHNSHEERLELAQSPVRQRMARLLASLSDTYGIRHGDSIHLHLALSREEMADMIGTAAETAMRFLKDFREENLLKVNGREIIILDQKKLSQTAREL